MENVQLNTMTREQKINYYVLRDNNVVIRNGNSKTGKKVATMSMPASFTCRKDAPCKEGCYCLKGCQTWPVVIAAYTKNYRLWRENHNDFFNQVSDYLDRHNFKWFRWFDAGDIPEPCFIDYMVRLAKNHPTVRFMSFTKHYEWVNEYLANNDGKLPKNLNIVFSNWDKDWNFENPFNLPVSYVNFTDSSKNRDIPQDAKQCKNDCSSCFRCWLLKRGQSVEFHQH